LRIPVESFADRIIREIEKSSWWKK
jgi:hypothetical protein